MITLLDQGPAATVLGLRVVVDPSMPPDQVLVKGPRSQEVRITNLGSAAVLCAPISAPAIKEPLPCES